MTLDYFLRIKYIPRLFEVKSVKKFPSAYAYIKVTLSPIFRDRMKYSHGSLANQLIYYRPRLFPDVFIPAVEIWEWISLKIRGKCSY
jgi:hypothetical protein